VPAFPSTAVLCSTVAYNIGAPGHWIAAKQKIMTTINEVAMPRPGESSPLLGQQQTRAASVIDGSGEEADSGKANQQVGKMRGFLIIMSLWGLIFLQGKLPEPFPCNRET
jgi:hypothetical protein